MAKKIGKKHLLQKKHQQQKKYPEGEELLEEHSEEDILEPSAFLYVSEVSNITTTALCLCRNVIYKMAKK